MEDLQQKLEGIRSAVQSFKMEQEKLILKSSEALKGPSNSSNQNRRTSANIAKKVILPLTETAKTGDEAAVLQLLNVDSVIMPVPASSSEQKLWPQALVAKYSDNSVSVGSIEAHGSLWRLTQRTDGFAGCRVYIQASEIGEEPRFLSPSLHLVSQKGEAGVWNLRRCLPPKDQKALSFESSSTKGVMVALELVDPVYQASFSQLHNLAEPYAPITAQDLGAYPKTTVSPNSPSSGPSLLTLCTSQLSSDAVLLLASAKYANEAKEKDSLKHYSIVWEICPESWINEDLDYLDRFLG